MATYRITFASPDRHSEMNGAHATVANGAQFIARYGDGLFVEYFDGMATGSADSRDFLPSDIDTLCRGESLVVYGDHCEEITVERIA